MHLNFASSNKKHNMHILIVEYEANIGLFTQLKNPLTIH